MNVAAAHDLLTNLENALEERKTAWDNEKLAWTELRTTLNKGALLDSLDHVAALMDKIDQERSSIGASVDGIEKTLNELEAKVDKAQQQIVAIQHNPTTSPWMKDMIELESNVAEKAPQFVQSVASLTNGLGAIAAADAVAVGTKVSNAANRLALALPGHETLVNTAADSLSQGVTDAFGELNELLRTDDATVRLAAQQLGTSVIQYQFEHANGLLQDVVEFRAGLQQAIAVVTSLGQNLERLRCSLDTAINESNSPIMDIRHILTDLSQRFRSV